MKILFATVPADGHFNPLTGIAMHFKHLGHDVRWYTSKTYEKKLSGMDIPLFPFVQAKEVNSENLNLIYPEVADMKGVKAIKFAWEKVFLDNIGNHFQDINAIYQTDFRFDIFVCDAALYVMQFVAEKLKTPIYVIGPSPLTATSKDTPPNFVGLTPAKSAIGKKLYVFMRHLMDKMVFTEGMKKFNAMRTAIGLPPFTGSFWNIPFDYSTLYFQSGIPEFEYKRSDLSPNVRFVGGLQPYLGKAQKNYKSIVKMDGYEKVILVSQGTIDNKDQNKLIIPVLNALKDEPFQLIVATGGVNTELLREKYRRPNIIIEDYIDFRSVLPFTNLYITNGGYGGVILSLSFGVPMLCAGITAGKNDVNAHVRYFKVGIDLRTDHPSEAKIAKGVQQALSVEIAQNARNLQRILSTYHPNELIEQHVFHSE
ncbi:MAG TPA: glycosyltransferase [Saprospiraceae bacterium]|nr:glycosyltransferase family 1 protein [Saprospiraceae bacterium]MCB9268178.1 glycosyltransferase family 1 protein [Lewinellaceae bacterium]HPG09644.1 glycosyltransferase [Saprospiraceae bacterium]HPR01577.1 glycosyltransferase [Saprospiraceae bacterium]HRV86967.1 glycosyltransferase [Saprospiraceae bacterium]